LSLAAPLPRATLLPYTTLVRSGRGGLLGGRRFFSRFFNCRLAHGLFRRGGFGHRSRPGRLHLGFGRDTRRLGFLGSRFFGGRRRSEEHTSELQSRENLVCRLLL